MFFSSRIRSVYTLVVSPLSLSNVDDQVDRLSHPLLTAFLAIHLTAAVVLVTLSCLSFHTSTEASHLLRHVVNQSNLSSLVFADPKTGVQRDWQTFPAMVVELNGTNTDSDGDGVVCNDDGSHCYRIVKGQKPKQPSIVRAARSTTTRSISTSTPVASTITPTVLSTPAIVQNLVTTLSVINGSVISTVVPISTIEAVHTDSQSIQHSSPAATTTPDLTTRPPPVTDSSKPARTTTPASTGAAQIRRAASAPMRKRRTVPGQDYPRGRDITLSTLTADDVVVGVDVDGIAGSAGQIFVSRRLNESIPHLQVDFLAARGLLTVSSFALIASLCIATGWTGFTLHASLVFWKTFDATVLSGRCQDANLLPDYKSTRVALQVSVLAVNGAVTGKLCPRMAVAGPFQVARMAKYSRRTQDPIHPLCPLILVAGRVHYLESWLMAVTSLIAGWTASFANADFRLEFHTWVLFSALGVLATVLTGLTIVFALIRRGTFGTGLAEYLNAQPIPDRADTAPLYKATTFPCQTNELPTFSLASSRMSTAPASIGRTLVMPWSKGDDDAVVE
ncbi:hypothetical protein P7C73_g2318, partial [Tremellales sp. Uapishka_1]